MNEIEKLKARIDKLGRIADAEYDRRVKAEAELAALAAQKPFMYGIMTANGDAYFEEFCVSSDPAWLEDEIWEWNNGLADNEPKNRVVPLFTRAAPAGVVVPCPNEDAANAMHCIFYQTRETGYKKPGHVLLCRSEAVELAKWLTSVLDLRDEANNGGE